MLNREREREREKKKNDIDLNISSQNNSAKISCNLQLITSKISLKWCISTVLLAMKIYQGEALHNERYSFRCYRSAIASSCRYAT